MTTPTKKVSIPLIFGIVFLPFIFSWFTLRNGYSNQARIFSFIPLVLILCAGIFGEPEKKKGISSVEPKTQLVSDQKMQIEPQQQALKVQSDMPKPQKAIVEKQPMVQEQPQYQSLSSSTQKKSKTGMRTLKKVVKQVVKINKKIKAFNKKVLKEKAKKTVK